MKYFILCILLLRIDAVNAQPTLKLFTTIESIGYKVLLPNDYDTDSTATIIVRYRSGSDPWKEVFPPTRLEVDSVRQFRGSLFFLHPGTKYEVEITITDSTPNYRQNILNDTISTRREPTIDAGSGAKYVSPTGVSLIYSKNQPGSLKALFASGLTCGTTVILLGGTYDVGNMNLSLTQECTEGTPIVIMAAPGMSVIFEGGDHTQYTWTKTSGDPDMYTTTIKAELAYNALCLFDSTRLYPYAFLTPSSLSPSYPSLENLGYEASGFYRKGTATYIKTLNKKDPNSSHIVFSKYFWCLSVDGGNKNNYIYFKGITFRYYNLGKSDFDVFGNPTASYPSWTLGFTNANHLIVDSCIFLYTNFPVTFNGKCDYNIVQNCTMIDGTGYWSHGAFKQTRDVLYLEPGSYGRYLENTGVFFSPGNGVTLIGNIVRNNKIKGIVTSMGLGFGQTYRMTEYDISGNDISYCYDGIDATAACINTRIWNNRISYCPVGISLILPTFGPTYILRNLIDHISERKNQNDIFFADCDGTLSNKIWGTGLKLNAGGSNALPGFIYFIHNTIHSSDTLGFNMYLWFSTWKQLYSRNNIFYSEGKANFFFDGIGGDSAYSFNSLSDNYYNTSTGTLAIIQPVNGISNCDYLSSTLSLDETLRSRTRSKYINVTGFNLSPGFKSLLQHDYSLAASSPLIDKGVLIPGINESFKNAAPDIGAFESDTTTVHSFVSMDSSLNASFRISPNPASDRLKVLVDTYLGCDQITLYDINGKKVLSYAHFVENEVILDTSKLPSGVYLIEVETRMGLGRQKWVKQ